jgi:phosphoribosylformylglycinamidine synthase
VKATVLVRRRADISDPQGLTVARALRELGYEDVVDVRIDKNITIRLPDGDPKEARARVIEMCEKLLANPAMEDYEVVVEP